MTPDGLEAAFAGRAAFHDGVRRVLAEAGTDQGSRGRTCGIGRAAVRHERDIVTGALNGDAGLRPLRATSAGGEHQADTNYQSGAIDGVGHLLLHLNLLLLLTVISILLTVLLV